MSKKYDWPQLIADFERSDLRLSQYTRQHGIPYSSMYQQVNKLKNKRKPQSQMILLTQEVHELSLQNHKLKSSLQPFRMKLGQAELEFQNLPNPQWLAEVIKCF
jgi:hypothetical protein